MVDFSAAVSIRVHSGIGLEVCNGTDADEKEMRAVSIRVHSGIGLEGPNWTKCEDEALSFNPRSQRHRVGSPPHLWGVAW